MNNMIRVGIIITRMVAGGASGIVRSLIKGGAGRFEFVLMTGDEDVQTGEIDALKEFCDIRLVSDLRRAISPFCDIRAYPNLRREIRGLALDVVHTHTSKAGVLGRFAACAEGVPQIIHSTHGSIYEVGGRIEGVPEISIFKRCLLLIERAAGKRADFLTVLSERERSAAVEFGLDIDAKIRVVPNGIDIARFAVDDDFRSPTRVELGFAKDDKVFLSVGRLSSEKGHSVLLDAFANLAVDDNQRCRLLIVGEGPEMESLKRKAASIAGVEMRDVSQNEFGKIRFTGHCRDIRGFLAAANVFVLPSLYEGFGIVLLEAMAAGLPIVATSTGGVPEILGDGAGTLVEPGDASAISVAMSRLLDDAKLAANMVAAGQRTVERYSLERMLNAYFELYER